MVCCLFYLPLGQLRSTVPWFVPPRPASQPLCTVFAQPPFPFPCTAALFSQSASNRGGSLQGSVTNGWRATAIQHLKLDRGGAGRFAKTTGHHFDRQKCRTGRVCNSVDEGSKRPEVKPGVRLLSHGVQTAAGWPNVQAEQWMLGTAGGATTRGGVPATPNRCPQQCRKLRTTSSPVGQAPL